MRINWRNITWELADNDESLTIDTVILAWAPGSTSTLTGRDIRVALHTIEVDEANAVYRYHQNHTCKNPVCSTPSMVRTSAVAERPTDSPSEAAPSAPALGNSPHS